MRIQFEGEGAPLNFNERLLRHQARRPEEVSSVQIPKGSNQARMQGNRISEQRLQQWPHLAKEIGSRRHQQNRKYRLADGRSRKAKEGQIIDVEKVHKRKLIKKQSSGKKEKCIEIEIYDGSDSELKML